MIRHQTNRALFSRGHQVSRGHHAGRFQPAIGLETLILVVLVALLPQANVFGQFNVAAPYPLSETFFLESLPGATKTIFMDFDGHNGVEGNYAAYDFEGGAGTFTDNEKREIQLAWQSVAEDFLPFNVNVTTKDPGVEALRNTGGSDDEWGIRTVVTASVWDYSWAYISSFNWDSDYEAFAWAPDEYVGDGERGTDWLWVADSVNHEVGHALGLSHDGPGYYGGHGTDGSATYWAPIMGWTWFGPSQWSKGEYAGANNQQDDLDIITNDSSGPANGFGYRTDDHGSNTGSATPITDGVLAEGIIERNTDLDYFSFTMSSAGNVTFDINPNKVGADHWYGTGTPTGTVGANLDILAEIRDSNDTVIHTSNPLNTLDASFDVNLIAGDYYLSIDGTGFNDPDGPPDDGYSDYGSLGYYSILGSGFAVPEPSILALIDIKPGGSANVVNPKSKGVLSVAILGTADFDVNDVNIDTLLFGDPLLIDNGGTAVSPLRSSLVDISGDGLLDLTLKFSTRDLVEFGALGSDTIEGILTGETLDGIPFEGLDSIRIVPANWSKGNNLQISSVPEPTTSLLALAALCLAMSRRRAH